ncbi:hypothetical protein HPB49_000783 [Dermacentor silvarum]|uniref:Uncharacterized protein n=1 Tax=Dermacentor silvarum TaxID=543639 RepID=A0ACB8DSC1_DERSI|nr:hypothetical protein HPB49_000783 [Dermacentor silvarum]
MEFRPSWGQVVSGLFNSVFSLGLVACIVSHYRMGARSWNQRSSAHEQPSMVFGFAVRSSDVDSGGPFLGRALYSSASAAERQRAALAAARDAQVRAASVRTDLALELPPTVALPEEHPLAGSVRLRDADQEQELYGACVRAPPNRTVRDGSPPCGGGRLRRVVVRSNSVTPCNRTARWHSPDCQRPGGV